MIIHAVAKAHLFKPYLCPSGLAWSVEHDLETATPCCLTMERAIKDDQVEIDEEHVGHDRLDVWDKQSVLVIPPYEYGCPLAVLYCFGCGEKVDIQMTVLDLSAADAEALGKVVGV